MKNKKSWEPSKFVYKHGKLVASRNLQEVGVSSRLIANIMASFYGDHIKEHCRGKLVDLGCGKVPLYEACKNLVDEHICVDWPNTLHKNQYLDFECDLTQELPFKDQEFDTIILSDVLEHIPQPEYLWKEMSRILKKDGKILLNVPFYYWLHEAPYDYYRYTEYALRRFAELEGFEVIFLEAVGGMPEVIADMLAKFIHFRPLIGNFLANAIQNITYIFIHSQVGKRISKSTSKRSPLGYFMIVKKA
ncbi:MAG: class I SAM-dependent methyltransferase [Symploca sp. SIO3E6]|nr:class I SAM-dependent methyltransferase [Caldora sp. SIO3E6]